MWVLIATYISAIVRVCVSGTGIASWLIAPTEDIHMDDSGISVVALLELHTYQQLHQLGVFIQPLFIVQYMSARRRILLHSNTNSRNSMSYIGSFMM